MEYWGGACEPLSTKRSGCSLKQRSNAELNIALRRAASRLRLHGRDRAETADALVALFHKDRCNKEPDVKAGIEHAAEKFAAIFRLSSFCRTRHDL